MIFFIRHLVFATWEMLVKEALRMLMYVKVFSANR